MKGYFLMERKPLWKDTALRNRAVERLEGSKEAEVVVIGGGITGLTTALILAEAGKKVIVLEASTIGDGTTGYSSCHLTTDIDEEYRSISSDFNDEITEIVAESRKTGIAFIEKISKEKNIDCDFQRVSGYWYTEMAEDVSKLKEEFEAALKTGLEISMVNNVPLPFPVKKGLKFENQAQFHSQKYLNGIADYLKGKGCELFEQSQVNHIDEKDDYYWVKTSSGTVKAKRIVLATHLPIFFNVLQMVTAPYRSYMIAVRLNNENYPEGLFWDTAEPYHYIRTYRDTQGPLLLVGGADHKTGDEEASCNSFPDLEKYTRERFDVKEIAYRWSGQYYEPADGLPYIGRTLFSKNAYVATGFSGDGLVYGTIAGLLISDMILEKENRWLRAYDSRRFTPAASAFEFIKENADVFKHFISDRKADAEQLSEVKAGEGKIVKINGEKLAIARDEHNELHALSPVCTHMKCFVQWNYAEKSWDCPCHGSRFSIDGEVIYGPAVKELEKKVLDFDLIKKNETIKKG
jgi:glycine/D-amino acid oxidase-like deaminating enzyme/nitrite reductase/ring-hydroxylating ferredoxin subunit